MCWSDVYKQCLCVVFTKRSKTIRIVNSKTFVAFLNFTFTF